MEQITNFLNIQPNVDNLEERVSKLSIDNNEKKVKKEKSVKTEKTEKRVKKEICSETVVSEDKKKKPLKKSETDQETKKVSKKEKAEIKPKDILCGFPLITKKGEQCTRKGLAECGGRCKMHSGK
jgi:hypothetical protein